MPSFGSPDDDTKCPGCGCELEVIGPPGPAHSDACPTRAQERENTAAFNAHFRKLVLDGSYKCGCVIRSGNVVGSPCFRQACQVMQRLLSGEEYAPLAPSRHDKLLKLYRLVHSYCERARAGTPVGEPKMVDDWHRICRLVGVKP